MHIHELVYIHVCICITSQTWKKNIRVPFFFAHDSVLHQPLNTCCGIRDLGALELLLYIVERDSLIPPLKVIGAPVLYLIHNLKMR